MLLEKEWLRRPKVEKLKEIKQRYRKFEFSVCIGTMYCVEWYGIAVLSLGRVIMKEEMQKHVYRQK